MIKKTSTGKSKKKFWIISGIIILILSVLIFTANSIAEKLVMDQIHKQFNDKPDNLYTIESAKLKINILNGTAKVTEIKVVPSDSAYRLLETSKIKTLMEISIDRFTIRSLDLLKFIREGNIHLGQITSSSVNISLIFDSKYKKEETMGQSAFSNIFSSNFQIAEVSELILNNITLRIYNEKERQQPFFELDSLKLYCDNIHIDPGTLQHVIPFSFENINLETGGIFFNSSEYYNITTTDISFNLADTSLAIAGFELIPKYSKEVYNQKKKYNSDWYSITVPEIRLNHFHLKKMDSLRLFHFSSIELQDPSIKIYRDKTLPDPPFKYKPLLASLLRKIPVDILVDTIKLQGDELIYEENISNNAPPGKVFFDPFFLTIYNVTNYEEAIKSRPTMEIDFSAYIMGKSQLNANINVNLTSNSDEFTASGTLKPIDAVAFNPVVENLLSVSIQSGQLHETTFHFRANDNHAEGQLKLFYENLKIQIMKENNQEENSMMMSLLANNLIRNKNLRNDRKYLVGTISFDRMKDKSLPNFLWKSIGSGIMPILAPVAAEKGKQKVKRKNR